MAKKTRVSENHVKEAAKAHFCLCGCILEKNLPNVSNTHWPTYRAQASLTFIKLPIIFSKCHLLNVSFTCDRVRLNANVTRISHVLIIYNIIKKKHKSFFWGPFLISSLWNFHKIHDFYPNLKIKLQQFCFLTTRLFFFCSCCFLHLNFF